MDGTFGTEDGSELTFDTSPSSITSLEANETPECSAVCVLAEVSFSDIIWDCLSSIDGIEFLFLDVKTSSEKIFANFEFSDVTAGVVIVSIEVLLISTVVVIAEAVDVISGEATALCRSVPEGLHRRAEMEKLVVIVDVATVVAVAVIGIDFVDGKLPLILLSLSDFKATCSEKAKKGSYLSQ